MLIIGSVLKVLTNKVPYHMVYLLDLLLIELLFVKSIQRKLGLFASRYNRQQLNVWATDFMISFLICAIEKLSSFCSVLFNN